MKTQDDPPTKIAELPLTAFELPKWLVEPAVRACRLFNTSLDFIFYDVPTLRAALADKDAPMQVWGEKPPSRIIDFDALSDPEGSLLLIDATTATGPRHRTHRGRRSGAKGRGPRGLVLLHPRQRPQARQSAPAPPHGVAPD